MSGVLLTSPEDCRVSVRRMLTDHQYSENDSGIHLCSKHSMSTGRKRPLRHKRALDYFHGQRGDQIREYDGIRRS